MRESLLPSYASMAMNVLVTGGTGFIGHNIVLDLLEATGWTFTVVDAHRYSGLPGKLTSDPRFDEWRVRMVAHDLTKPFDAPGGRPDVIINLASNSHVDSSITDPVPFVMDNVAMTLNVLEYARVVKPRLFIQFSTDEVYGAAPPHLDFGEWSIILPSNPYAASKAAQEAIAISYWRTYDVPLVITNTMNVMGPRQHPEKFIPKTVQHLLRGEPMTVHAERVGDRWRAGSRFYTYVSNISDALRFLMWKYEEGVPLHHTSSRPDRFNIVGDREVYNDEMVDLIADILGVESLKTYVDFHGSRPGHDRRYALSGAKLRDAGWEPPVSFEDGLRLSVKDAQ